MTSDKFPRRLDLLRDTFTEGPNLSLLKLSERAKVSVRVLACGYGGPIREDLRSRLAIAAAELLGLDADSVEAFLVGEVNERGERYWPDVPCVEDYLRWLPTQVACTRCGEWFTRGDESYVEPFRRCKPCVRASQNPSAGLYDEMLRARLPEIRARCPALADAVQVTLDAREAPTYERLAARAQLSSIAVARLLKNMGLDKRNLPNPTKAAAKRKLSEVTLVAVMMSASLHTIPIPVEPPTTMQGKTSCLQSRCSTSSIKSSPTATSRPWP